MDKPLGTREHYQEYCRNCADAGVTPETWELFRMSYEDAPLHDIDTAHDDMTPAEIAECEAKRDDKPSRFTTPALQAVNDLLLTLTIVAENSDEWKRFQYSGESKDVIIDRVDNHIMYHLDAVQAEIERLQAENARLRAALRELLSALDDQYLPANPKQFPPGTFEYALDNERLAAWKVLKDSEAQ